MSPRARTWRRIACAVLSAHVCTAVVAQGATVSIDPTVTYRTIDGLGFCAPPPSMYKVRQGAFMVEAEWEPFADTLITYVGMSMSRGFDTRSCDFCPSPGEYVITAAIREEMRKQRLLQHIADSVGEVYRFAPNVFSPAPWMKENNLCHKGENSNTNRLKPEHYDDFAAMCSAFVRICIDTFGVTPYAFSPQNEPAFPEPYASCVYSSTSYTHMLRHVGPSVERASPTTLIYGVEHMLWAFPGWENTVMADAQASQYLDRFAVHGATTDVNVDTSEWASLRRPRERDLWVSEFNWQKKDYDSCFGMAASVLNRLGDGANMTGYMAGGGYLFWDPAETGGAKTNGYFMNAQFMRFVRPGMTRIKATCDEPLLRVIAFRNDVRGSFSVVMVNGTDRDIAVTLNSTGSIPDSLEMRTTSRTQGFVEGEIQDGVSPITVPARGIVSLGYRVRASQSVAAQYPHSAVAERTVAARGAVRVFDLRGRALERCTDEPSASRVSASLTVRQDDRGRARIVVRRVGGKR